VVTHVARALSTYLPSEQQSNQREVRKSVPWRPALFPETADQQEKEGEQGGQKKSGRGSKRGFRAATKKWAMLVQVSFYLVLNASVIHAATRFEHAPSSDADPYIAAVVSDPCSAEAWSALRSRVLEVVGPFGVDAAPALAAHEGFIDAMRVALGSMPASGKLVRVEELPEPSEEAMLECMRCLKLLAHSNPSYRELLLEADMATAVFDVMVEPSGGPRYPTLLYACLDTLAGLAESEKHMRDVYELIFETSAGRKFFESALSFHVEAPSSSSSSSSSSSPPLIAPTTDGHGLTQGLTEAQRLINKHFELELRTKALELLMHLIRDETNYYHALAGFQGAWLNRVRRADGELVEFSDDETTWTPLVKILRSSEYFFADEHYPHPLPFVSVSPRFAANRKALRVCFVDKDYANGQHLLSLSRTDLVATGLAGLYVGLISQVLLTRFYREKVFVLLSRPMLAAMTLPAVAIALRHGYLSPAKALYSPLAGDDAAPGGLLGPLQPGPTVFPILCSLVGLSPLLLPFPGMVVSGVLLALMPGSVPPVLSFQDGTALGKAVPAGERSIPKLTSTTTTK
jgi:hypothetical protein